MKLLVSPFSLNTTLQRILLESTSRSPFLRFRTTTQVIGELLRRGLANRKGIVRQFGSLDPSAALEKGRGVEIVEPEMSGTKADK